MITIYQDQFKATNRIKRSQTGETMTHCERCGAAKSQDSGICPNCDSKKKSIWSRLGFVWSSIFLVIGATIWLGANQISNQMACGAAECSTAITQNSNVQDFFDLIGQGIQKVATYIFVTTTGVVLVLYGVIGLVISSIAAYRKHQSQCFVDGSK